MFSEDADLRQLMQWFGAVAEPMSDSDWQRLLSSRAMQHTAIQHCLYRDRHYIQRSFRRGAESKSKSQSQILRLRQVLAARLSESLSIVQQRVDAFSVYSYPPDLPICAKQRDIVNALAVAQVVIVAGETGSGKTTQLPKLCAEQGRGIFGRIGHTQPRRIAARAVATRIASELDVELGDYVGYQFRFNDRCSERTRIKLMTDGILLAELARDKWLHDYDTIIIDEAHERSLNIDFLLGYMKTLLAKRPELKLIVTSATIDVQRFADYFTDATVVEVEGRSYPVTIDYLEPAATKNDEVESARVSGRAKYAVGAAIDSGDDSGSVAASVRRALAHIEAKYSATVTANDVLVFLPGEREIRDVSRHLSKACRQYEVLPLYSRLSQKEQQRVLADGDRAVGRLRRVVLATNVAETSLTVPGIGYVIDSGTARISEYSARSKLQRLPIVPVSQASARQRAGRCGRLAAGVCIRLYSEEDFSSRQPYTPPEILRSSLTGVILQMKRLGLGDIAAFPFIDPPGERLIRSGEKTLHELGALCADNSLSALGHSMSLLPVDPALARMLLAALDKSCVAEMLVIVSAIAVQDPREFPQQNRSTAEASHRRFWDPHSDFAMWLNLWSYYHSLRETLSENQLRRRCKKEFLSYLRLREWRNLHRQLVLAIKSLPGEYTRVSRQALFEFSGFDRGQTCTPGSDQRLEGNGVLAQSLLPSHYEMLHRALLTGVPLQVGKKEREDRRKQAGKKAATKQANDQRGRIVYRGARNLTFQLFPGSSQFKKLPAWIIAGEIIDTGRVYARGVARIEPQWLVRELGHLIKHQYAEPHWDIKRGQVIAYRSSSLYGLLLSSREQVNYARVDAVEARAIFIRQALVAEDLNPDRKLLKQAKFWRHNLAVINEVKTLEEKLRRRDLMANEDALFDFYACRLPESICSRASLWRWLVDHSSAQRSLMLTESDVLISDAKADNTEFPGRLEVQGETYPLRYCFAPGADDDGITLELPLSAIASLPVYRFDWLVPGLLLDKCIAMLKLLPKVQRRQLVPVPDITRQLLAKLEVDTCARENIPLATALAEQIAIYYGVTIDPQQWRAEAERSLDSVYQMRFDVVDAKGRSVGSSRNLYTLQQNLIEQIDQHVNQATAQRFQHRQMTEWSFDDLLQSTYTGDEDNSVVAFPALIDTGNAVTIELATTRELADARSLDGILRLATISAKDRVKFLKKQLRRKAIPVLPYVNIGSHDELINDLIMAAIAASCFDDFASGIPRNKAAFDRALKRGGPGIVDCANQLEKTVHELLEKYHQCCEQIQQKRVHFTVQCDDVENQLRALVYPGFIRRTGFGQLVQLPRYLHAILIRFDRLGANVTRDNENCEKLSTLYKPLENLLYKYPYAPLFDTDVRHFRWLLEELRVSLFAQQLKTAVPVSFQRVDKAWAKINLNKYPLLH